MNNTKKLVFSAFFLALGIVLPFITGQIPEIGSMLLPMHIPVLICGYVCGPFYGLLTGMILPLFRTLLFSMPPLPTAIAMAFELATYGFITGLLYGILHNHKMRIYVSLLCSMFLGRIVWGIVSLCIYNFNQSAFTWQIFLGGALLNAIPGIILQLILIPLLITTLEKTGVMKQYD